MSAPNALLLFAIFMAAVAALPSEQERHTMTGGDFAYGWLYRFLQNVCLNIRTINPALGALPERRTAETKL